MIEILPPWSLLAAFVTAAFVLAVTPGPGVFYIVTRSLVHGRRSGLASVAGVALGNLGNAVGAAVGLGALFAVSAVAFSIVKYAGALYLVYLGVQALRRRLIEASTPLREPTRSWPIFRDGFIVALFNPKTAIFFAAFLPQFMTSKAAPMFQGVALGALFVAIAALTDTVYAVAAGVLAPFLSRARGVSTFGRYLSGGALIGLGAYTALAGTRSGR